MKTEDKIRKVKIGIIENCKRNINKLVEQHLTMETAGRRKTPFTAEERMMCLMDTYPNFDVDEAQVMLCVAIVMLVEEREPKK